MRFGNNCARKGVQRREAAAIAKAAADNTQFMKNVRAESLRDASNKADAAERNAFSKSQTYFKDHKNELKGDAGENGATGTKGRDAPLWPDAHFKAYLQKTGIISVKTNTLSQDAKDDFRKTNWQEKLSDNSPFSQGWFGHAYIASMYSTISQCVSYVKHITAPLHGGSIVPTAVNTVDDPEGGAMDTSQFKKTAEVPYQSLLQVDVQRRSAAADSYSETVVALGEDPKVYSQLSGVI